MDCRVEFDIISSILEIPFYFDYFAVDKFNYYSSYICLI